MSEALPDGGLDCFEFRRNGREYVKIRIDTYKGTVICDVRTWWRNDAGESRPGRHGISVGVHHLPALALGIGKALEQANALGLLQAKEDES